MVGPWLIGNLNDSPLIAPKLSPFADFSRFPDLASHRFILKMTVNGEFQLVGGAAKKSAPE